MIVLDFSIVSIALPSMQAEFAFEPGDLQWVISAYTIVFAGFLMIAGRLCDIFGRRAIFAAGLIIFTFASFAAGLAHSPIFLVVMRAVQGLGAAMVNPAALAIVTDLFEEGAPRNRALGLWGIIGSAGLTGGILLGGLLTSAFGWRAIFFVNVPIGALLLILTPIFVQKEARAAAIRQIDYLGALLMTSAILLFVFAVEEMADDGWSSFATLARLAGAAILLAAFLVVERRARNPVMPPDLFTVPNLSSSSLAAGFQGAAYASLFVYASIYFQTALHWPPWRAAMAFLPMSILLTVIAGPCSAPLATRFGGRAVGLGAGLLMIVGGVIMTLLNASTPYLIGALPGTVIAGFGCMLTYQMSMMVGLAHIEPLETGAASGLLSTATQVGLSLGVAVGATLVATALQARGAFDAAIAFSILTTLAFLLVRPIGAATPGAAGLRPHAGFGKVMHSTGPVQAGVQGRST